MRLIQIVLSVFFLSALLSCDKEEEPTCSDLLIVQESKPGTILDSAGIEDPENPPLWMTGLDGEIRWFEREFQINNVCPYGDVSGGFTINIEDLTDPDMNTDIPISADGWIRYSNTLPLAKVQICELITPHDRYKNTVLVNLQEAFGDERANFWLGMRIFFESFGSEEEDKEFITKVLESYRFETLYYLYNE